MNRLATAVVALLLCSASLFAGDRPASKIGRDPLTRASTPPDARESIAGDDDEKHEVVRDGKIFRQQRDERGVLEGRREDYLRRHGVGGIIDSEDLLKRTREFYEHERGRVGILSVGGSVWSSIGPTNGAGRMTSLAPHPSVPGTLLAGAAGGGLWKTTDSGTTWSALTDTIPNLSIGAVAYAPSNPSNIYLGTGENAMQGDSIPGIGLLYSSDDGGTWSLPSSVIATHFYRISVDPSNPAIVLAGTTSGLLRSTNGQSGPWTTVIRWGATSSATGYGDTTDVVRDPTAPQTLFATTWDEGWWCAQPARNCGIGYPLASPHILKSIDGGVTWAESSNGLPVSTSTVRVSRLGIAMARSSSQTLYVSLVTYDSTTNLETWHVYKSTNGSASWSDTTLASNTAVEASLGAQSDYDNTMVVSPTNPNTVYVGAVGYAKTTDGGTSWTSAFNSTSTDSIHTDVHDLRFDAGGTFFIANDGGIFSTADGGVNILSRNTNLVTRQFYTVANDPVNRNRVFGGQQDNGTSRRPDAGGTSWHDVLTNDGFDCEVKVDSAAIVFGSWQGGHVLRSKLAGVDWLAFSDVTPLWPVGESVPFFTRVQLDPATPSTVYTVSQRLWKSTDGGDSWAPLPTTTTDGSAFSGYPLAQLAISRSNPQVIMVGDYRNIFRTTNGGQTWTKVSAGLPPRSVLSIEIDPTNPNDAYVSLSANTVNSSVYSTIDGGASWTLRASGLPAFSAEVVRVDPTDPQTLYCGTDVGVYRSTDGGSTWARFGTGMPAVSVYDLQVLRDGTIVRAATHGRGMWELTVTSPANKPPVVSASSTPSGSPVLAPIGSSIAFTGTFSDPDGDVMSASWVFSDDWTTVPFGMSGGTVSHTFLRSGRFPVTLSVRDSRGGIGASTIDVLVNEGADNCLTPIVLPSTITSPYTMTFDNAAASTEASDPMGSTSTGGCNQYSYTTSLWLSFTPAISGPYTFSLHGSAITSVLTGYTASNSCGPYTPAGVCLMGDSTRANADLTNDPLTTANLAAGVTLYLDLSNYYTFDTGFQSVTITPGSTSPSSIVNFAGPTVGPAAGGTPVTITGAGFVSGATVAFGGVAATSVTLATPNIITVIAPAHAAGTVDVTMTNPGGPSATLRGGFSYVAPPGKRRAAKS
jgi:photosystem II stability/assembly factor-like uncharacterized protein